MSRWEGLLTTESIQGASLALQGVDNIHGCDGLPLGVLSVGDSIPDDVLKELLHDTTGFLVVEATVSQTADGQLVDTLDFVSQYLPVPLCIPFLSPFPPLPRPDMIAN